MNRVMVDIETMGNGPQAAIVAIGAADFDSEVSFYVRVDLQSSMDAGLKIDASAVLWWLQQSGEARAELQGAGLALSEALNGFAAWLGGGFKKDGCELWAYPASFDLVILENAYRSIGRASPPWHYRAPRCLRTLVAISGFSKLSATSHHAGKDASAQVAWAKSCLKRLKR